MEVEIYLETLCAGRVKTALVYSDQSGKTSGPTKKYTKSAVIWNLNVILTRTSLIQNTSLKNGGKFFCV